MQPFQEAVGQLEGDLTDLKTFHGRAALIHCHSTPPPPRPKKKTKRNENEQQETVPYLFRGMHTDQTSIKFYSKQITITKINLITF